jgi:hypothetical protein
MRIVATYQHIDRGGAVTPMVNANTNVQNAIQLGAQLQTL